jgi:pimeloyl-ACP methyl ester carboxylesterase
MNAVSKFVPGPQGHKLHIVDWGGDGLPILLLHGMGAHTHWWDLAAPLLAQKFRVVAMDLRGHGDSEWTESPQYQVSDYAADIDAVRSYLGWEKFFLVGHSMGARACIHYAREYGQYLAKLAVLDFLTAVVRQSQEKYERKMKRRQPSYSSKEKMVSAYHLQPSGTTLSEEALRAIGGQSVRQLDNGRWTWKFDWRAFFFEYTPVWEDLSDIKVPCLVLRGEHSTVMNAEDFKKVLEALKDGHGQVISGTYHHIPLDAPETVAGVLSDFACGSMEKS